MTLAEVIAAWAARYSLTLAERLTVGEAVALSIDYGWFATFPPMGAELAAKLGTRTLREVARRVLAERLLGDASELRQPPPPEPVWYVRPPAPVVQASREEVIAAVSKEKAFYLRAKTCGHCRRPGHNRTTCPRLRD